MGKKGKDGIAAGTIGRATSWSFAAEFAAKIIVPLTNMILARLLAPEAFGIITSVSMVVSMAETLSSAGFQKYLVQHQYRDETEFHQSATVAFWANFTVSFLLWGAIALWNEPIARAIGSPGYGKALTVAAISLPLLALSSVQEALFQRKFNYKALFYRRVAVSLTPLFVTVPLAFLGLEHWALIIGTIAGNVVKVLMLSGSRWKPTFYFNFRLLKRMFSFGVWMLFESIALWATTYIDILIINNQMDSYYTGLYKNSQNTVTGILSIVTASTTSVLFASLSRRQEDDEEMQRTFFQFQKNVAIFLLPIGVGIFCYSDLITRVLLGSQWTEAAPFIGIWGLCTSLVCVFGTFSREYYRAKGKPNISLYAQVLHLLFVVPVCLIAVKHGFLVLSYARSLAFLQIIVVHLCFMKFVFGVSPLQMFKTVKEPMLSAVLMGGISTLLLYFHKGSIYIQFAYIFISGIFYFAVLLLFPSYRKELQKIFSHLKKKLHKEG